jgi:hypothetical protein
LLFSIDKMAWQGISNSGEIAFLGGNTNGP